jgi:hypothetical protein
MTTSPPVPRPAPPSAYQRPPQPLAVPTLAECLVRIEQIRARRRGPHVWHTPQRQQRAAALLHALLLTAYEHDVELSDFDAATDLPAAVYDVIILAGRVEDTR